MKIRVFLLVVLAVFALSAVALAQSPGQHRGPMGRIAKELQLSQDQVQKITAIAKQYFDDVKTTMQSNAAEADKTQKVQALKTKAASDIMALLTADQQTKATEMHATDMILSPRDWVARFRQALAQLNLSPDQQDKIKAIITNAEAKVKAIRSDSSLAPAAKASQLQELQKTTIDSVTALLTPDQQTQLKELMEQHAGGATGGHHKQQ